MSIQKIDAVATMTTGRKSLVYVGRITRTDGSVARCNDAEFHVHKSPAAAIVCAERVAAKQALCVTCARPQIGHVAGHLFDARILPVFSANVEPLQSRIAAAVDALPPAGSRDDDHDMRADSIRDDGPWTSRGED